MEKQNKKSNFNWTTISSIGTIISSSAAIIAIILGICQFNKSIERTDKQIALLIQEREMRIEENRPFVTINKNKIYGFKDMKQYSLLIGNIGLRPAYNITLRNISIASNNDFSRTRIVADTTFSITNPLSAKQEIDYIGNLILCEYPNYYIFIKVDFIDDLTKKSFSQDFFFKWENLKDKAYKNDVLYGVDKDIKLKILNQVENLLNK